MVIAAKPGEKLTLSLANTADSSIAAHSADLQMGTATQVLLTLIP